jgi:hypothetical protein
MQNIKLDRFEDQNGSHCFIMNPEAVCGSVSEMKPNREFRLKKKRRSPRNNNIRSQRRH